MKEDFNDIANGRDNAQRTCVWVKCSERNPSVGDYYYVKINTKNDSILKVRCEWAKYPNGNYDWDYKGVEYYDDLREGSEVIEWLDESLSSCSASSGEGEEKKINPYKYISMINELLFMPAFTEFGARQYLEKNECSDILPPPYKPEPPQSK